MKDYGMDRLTAGDVDCAGCIEGDRPAGVYALPGPGGDYRAYRSQRGERKARTRRRIKRAARREGVRECREQQAD